MLGYQLLKLDEWSCFTYNFVLAQRQALFMITENKAVNLELEEAGMKEISAFLCK